MWTLPPKTNTSPLYSEQRPLLRREIDHGSGPSFTPEPNLVQTRWLLVFGTRSCMGIQEYRYHWDVSFPQLHMRESTKTVGVHSKRVFVLGPSHHVYLNGCALTKCTEYETPLGSLPIDVESAYPSSEYLYNSNANGYPQRRGNLNRLADLRTCRCKPMRTNIASRCTFPMFARRLRGMSTVCGAFNCLTRGL